MPYKIIHVLGSDLSKKGYVMNTQTGHKFSNQPIPLEKAKAQLSFLQGLESGMTPRNK